MMHNDRDLSGKINCSKKYSLDTVYMETSRMKSNDVGRAKLRVLFQEIFSGNFLV